MPVSNRIADRLSNAVTPQDRYYELMPGQEIEFLLAVVAIAQRPLNFEMIAPAAKFQSLVAPFRGALRQFLQR